MTQDAKKTRLLLIGAGNVGRRLMELLVQKREILRCRLGVVLVLVGVADSSGVAVSPAGLDPQELAQLKDEGRGVAAHPQYGRPGRPPLAMVRETAADILLEASPANLEDGQPGLSCIETALRQGMHVVTANKSPLVLAYPRLFALAQTHGGQLRFSATVGGGLPTINLGRRDLAAAQIDRLEGIVNLTTNYILTRMAEDGLDYEQALAEAQAAGHAETNPRLDVEGWDAASKLVILAHSVLGHPATLADVTVEGITDVTPEMLRQATAVGRRIKPLAMAERQGDHYRFQVGPVALQADHPMAVLGAEQMGIVYYTDIYGAVAASIVEETPLPTAAAMLRDVVDIVSWCTFHPQ